MTPIELLQRARTKIEGGWIKGWFARDKKGKRVSVGDSAACNFCLSGALYDDKNWLPEVEVTSRRYLVRSLPKDYDNIVGFNDDPKTTKQMVLDLIDEAIAIAENEQ